MTFGPPCIVKECLIKDYTTPAEHSLNRKNLYDVIVAIIELSNSN